MTVCMVAMLATTDALFHGDWGWPPFFIRSAMSVSRCFDATLLSWLALGVASKSVGGSLTSSICAMMGPCAQFPCV